MEQSNAEESRLQPIPEVPEEWASPPAEPTIIPDDKTEAVTEAVTVRDSSRVGSGRPFGLREACKQMRAQSAEELSIVQKLFSDSGQDTKELISLFGGYVKWSMKGNQGN